MEPAGKAGGKRGTMTNLAKIEADAVMAKEAADKAWRAMAYKAMSLADYVRWMKNTGGPTAGNVETLHAVVCCRALDKSHVSAVALARQNFHRSGTKLGTKVGSDWPRSRQLCEGETAIRTSYSGPD